MIAPAVATFREFAIPDMGIAMVWSAQTSTSSDTPNRSEPKTRIAGNHGCRASGFTLFAVSSATTTQQPAAFADRTYAAAFFSSSLHGTHRSVLAAAWINFRL